MLPTPVFLCNPSAWCQEKLTAGHAFSFSFHAQNERGKNQIHFTSGEGTILGAERDGPKWKGRMMLGPDCLSQKAENRPATSQPSPPRSAGQTAPGRSLHACTCRFAPLSAMQMTQVARWRRNFHDMGWSGLVPRASARVLVTGTASIPSAALSTVPPPRWVLLCGCAGPPLQQPAAFMAHEMSQ